MTVPTEETKNTRAGLIALIVTAVLFFILGALVACAPQPVAFSAPAPATALDCALSQASQRGYTPRTGGVASGFITLTAPIKYTTGEKMKGAATRVASLGVLGMNDAKRNELIITGAGGVLRVEPRTYYAHDKRGDVSPSGRADAEGVLAACVSRNE